MNNQVLPPTWLLGVRSKIYILNLLNHHYPLGCSWFPSCPHLVVTLHFRFI